MKTNVKDLKETIKDLREHALVDDCLSCGKPNAFFWPELDDHYCPVCVKTHYILQFAAEKHLKDLLRERVIPLWISHYKSMGLDSKALKEIAKMIGYELDNLGFEDELKQAA